MKLAYIAMDRTAHKAHGVLERHYSTVDFYLADSNSKTLNIDVAELPIMAGNVCIPVSRSLRTVQHNLVMQEIKSEHTLLLGSIYPRKNLQNENLDAVPLTSGNIKNISDIHYIAYNREKQKYLFECVGETAVTEYDFLVIQDNQYVMSLLLDKQRDLFMSFTEQTKVILNFDFEVKHFTRFNEDRDFLFVDNCRQKTIHDNWYICQLRDKRISVSLYIPLEMQNSPSYLDFLAKRVTSVLNAAFDVFKVGALLSKSVLACDGFYTHRAKLRYGKSSVLIPTFTFWSQPKINNYISHLIKGKHNKAKAAALSEKAI
jgi:hypothetical protein